MFMEQVQSLESASHLGGSTEYLALLKWID